MFTFAPAAPRSLTFELPCRTSGLLSIRGSKRVVVAYFSAPLSLPFLASIRLANAKVATLLLSPGPHFCFKHLR